MLCSLILIYFDSPQLGIQEKQTVQNLRLLIQRCAQSWVFRKRSGNSFSTTFCVWFFKKNVSHMLCSINWPNIIIWLPLLREILGKMCIAIVCYPGCYVINFEINLIFLIKPFFYMTDKSRQTFKYLKNEKSFQGEINIAQCF